MRDRIGTIVSDFGTYRSSDPSYAPTPYNLPPTIPSVHIKAGGTGNQRDHTLMTARARARNYYAATTYLVVVVFGL